MEKSQAHHGPPKSADPGRVIVLLIVYAAAYFLAGWLDIHTTVLALTRPEATEGNVLATTPNGYESVRAWLITGLGFAVIAACLIWSAVKSPKVAHIWLTHPVRSFAKIYINPLGRSVRDRAPLHMMCFVVAFVPLRALAAANNLLIWKFGTGPLGYLIGVLSHQMGLILSFWLVMGPCFYAVAIACAPLSAGIMRWVQIRMPDIT